MVSKTGVILTKDNLAKRRWKGSLLCRFCNSKESIQHLFLDCVFARYIWTTVFFTFGIRQPWNTTHLFGNWLYDVEPKLKRQMWVGIAAICWALWLTRNDMVFNDHNHISFLQVIFRETHWARLWSLLLKKDEGDKVQAKCSFREKRVMEFFSTFSWNFRRRIEA